MRSCGEVVAGVAVEEVLGKEHRGGVVEEGVPGEVDGLGK